MDVPFRVIISEKGTWQKEIATYLLDKLRLLEVRDPFLIKNSIQVLEFLVTHAKEGLKMKVKHF